MSYTKPLICPKHNVERVYKKDSYRPSGKALHCPECTRELQSKYNKSRTSKDHKHYHLKAYGLTLEDYARLLEVQNGCCAICHLPETATNQYGVKQLAVDHNHKTGQVRGLLCSQCNQMLGRAKDNPTILVSAAQYLQRFED